jgi:hypothetical protein
VQFRWTNGDASRGFWIGGVSALRLLEAVALHPSQCVKILAPETAEFARCEPVFVSFQLANKLKRSGMAIVVNERPFVLRLRLHAVSYLNFTVWSSPSPLKFQLLQKRKRK